jgi:hypothetical protein
MVLPWWAASRFPAHLSASALSANLLVICHNGSTATAQGDLPQPIPQNPNSECPICKGLVGLQFAILVAEQAGLPERVADSQLYRSSSVELRDGILLAPRNRGPPSFV